MKSLLIAFAFMLSLPTFANEVLSCQLNPSTGISITKDQRNNYFYSVNGGRLDRLASAQTIQAASLRSDRSILDILKYMRIPASDVARVNVYKLTQNDDGGRTILRFFFKNDTYLAVHVSMNGVHPCR